MDEGEKARIPLMRLGSMRGRVSVQYETLDGSAVAGVKYEAAKGEKVTGSARAHRHYVVSGYREFWLLMCWL